MLAKFDNTPIVIIFIIVSIICFLLYLLKIGNYKIFCLVIFILILNELICGWIRFKTGTRLYNQARTRANKLNRKLVVIGNPTASWKNKLFGSSYGCGDVCIDLAGCECKAGETRTPPQEALYALSVMPSDSVVIFESGTKHIVPGLEDEMWRVGGKNVYSVSLDDTSIIRLATCLTGAIIL